MPKPKRRIRYIKTLQHLARKHKAELHFIYEEYIGWDGYFTTKDLEINACEDNFTNMLHHLHMKVRIEL